MKFTIKLTVSEDSLNVNLDNHEREREKDGFININNKTKQANGPKQSLFGLTTPIHIQIKQYEKEEKIKRKEKG